MSLIVKCYALKMSYETQSHCQFDVFIIIPYVGQSHKPGRTNGISVRKKTTFLFDEMAEGPRLFKKLWCNWDFNPTHTGTVWIKFCLTAIIYEHISARPFTSLYILHHFLVVMWEGWT